MEENDSKQGRIRIWNVTDNIYVMWNNMYSWNNMSSYIQKVAKVIRGKFNGNRLLVKKSLWGNKKVRR